MAKALCLSRLRRRCAATALIVATGAGASAAPARAEFAAFAGACTFTNLTVTFSPPSDLMPSPTVLTFVGGATCVVNGVPGFGTFSGVAATTPSLGWSCAAGVAVGNGTFDTTYPDMAAQPVSFVLAVAGPTMTIEAENLPVFVGVGEFVENAPTTTDCVSNRARSATSYAGVVAFEDPVVS